MRKGAKMVKKILLVMVLVLFSGTIVSYFGMGFVIRSKVDEICRTAMAQYDGTGKAEALINVLKSDTQSLEAKNDAIYALGYVRDTNALPVLRGLRTGTACDHGRFVCQRALNRTIRYMEGKEKNIYDFR